MLSTPALVFLVVAPSGGGKGVLLRALRDMGEHGVFVVPKKTTRAPKATDGPEMISVFPRGSRSFGREWDIRYKNYKASYAISSKLIWENLAKGGFQLLIVSNLHAIRKLRRLFGPAVRLVFIHSPVADDVLQTHQRNIGAEDQAEIDLRKEKVETVRQYYYRNIVHFDHVLLNIREPEDLTDQMFRIFRA